VEKLENDDNHAIGSKCGVKAKFARYREILRTTGW
jgi:hypothetical protein